MAAREEHLAPPHLPGTLPGHLRRAVERGDRFVDLVGARARGPRFYLRHLRANARTAIVVDDLDTADGWRPSGILIKGDTRFHETGR